MAMSFPLYPCIVSAGSVLATPENAEEVQGAGLLCCTSSAKLQHLEVKCYHIAPSI